MTTRHLINALWATAATVTITCSGQAYAQGQGQNNQGPQSQPYRIGQQTAGELTNQDFTTPDGTHIDVYAVQLTGGENYRFTLQADRLAAGVSVFTTDGDLIENAQVEFFEDGLTIQVPNTGAYSVAVMSRDTGRYTLTSRSGVAAPVMQESQGVPEGFAQSEGELDRNDPVTGDGILYDYVDLNLVAGQTYYFGVVGRGFTPGMSVQDAEGNVLELVVDERDDSTQVIAVTAQATGPHYLFILADAQGKSGSYTLTRWEGDAPGTQDAEEMIEPEPARNNGPRPVNNNGPRPDNSDAADADDEPGQIMIQAVLDQGDLELESGSYFGYHYVELTAGVTYTIELTADNFDTIAYLFDADNNQLATNDDAPRMGTNSRIVFTPDVTGEYSVGVSSVKAQQTGNYSINITQGTPQEPRMVEDDVDDITDADDTPAADDGPIFYTEAEASAEQGYYSGDFYLEAGQTIVIETFGLSDGCDTVIALRKSTNPEQASLDDPILAENDDDEMLLSSRIVYTAQEAGDYYVSVGVYENAAGSFKLIVRDALPTREPIVAQGVPIEKDSFVIVKDIDLGSGPNIVVIETYDLSDNCDTVIELCQVVDPENPSEDDPVIAANDDFFTNVLFSRIYTRFDEPGNHYIRIRNIGKGDGTCTFRIRFEE
ncbi:MAG: PPC domain-containing protein [Phycisphaerales bacterium JB063]